MDSIKSYFSNLGRGWRAEKEFIRYLDLGSGGCNGTRIFADFLERQTGMVVKPTGIDSSYKCEALCRQKNIDYVCLQLGAEEIPIKGFEVVTMFETIEHIFNTDYLLKSIAKSISRDGVLLVTTLNVVCWKNRILVPLGIQPFNTEVSTEKLIYGYRFNRLKKTMSTWKPAGHIRPFTLYSLRDILEDNGFTTVRSYGLENWRAFRFLESIAKNMCTGILVIAKPSPL
jgi:2-polyprenyl-3-methyl-5-hydroxy-6-metoxy-1,4-benzoquinol methylase